jgi:hypothetical protein
VKRTLTAKQTVPDGLLVEIHVDPTRRFCMGVRHVCIFKFGAGFLGTARAVGSI